MRHAKRLEHKGAAPSPRKVPHSDRDALSLEEETKPKGPAEQYLELEYFLELSDIAHIFLALWLRALFYYQYDIFAK